MEKNNKHVRVGFSTILWTVLAILLCAAPNLRADVDIPNDGVEYNIPGDFGPIISGNLNVYGTVNLLTGANITYILYAWDSSSVVNIKGGQVGWWITVMNQYANITVYGKYFEKNGTPLDPIPNQVTFDAGTNMLLVTYSDDTSTTLTFDSSYSITINLVNTAGGDPIEAQLWVFPSLINRYGPLSKILAIVRLPEGITKDKIDSVPLLLNPGGIEAACQYAFEWYEEGTVRTTIIASFDKASLMAAVPDGEVGLQVSGQLNTGESFCGSDTVTIVSWPW